MRSGARHPDPDPAGARPSADVCVLPRPGRSHQQRLRARPAAGGDPAQEHERLPCHGVGPRRGRGSPRGGDSPPQGRPEHLRNRAQHDHGRTTADRLFLPPWVITVPQFSFEIVRAVEGLGSMIRAVCLIPGASEFGYDVVPVSQSFGLGATRPENRHQLQAATDVAASLDALQALCPNLRRVSLVVSWFGDDLRAGHCTLAPRVESATKITDGDAWSVAGLTRAAARVVSSVNGTPSYGSTPSDAGVIRLIEP